MAAISSKDEPSWGSVILRNCNNLMTYHFVLQCIRCFLIKELNSHPRRIDSWRKQVMELLLTTIRRLTYGRRATVGRATPTRAIYTHDDRSFQSSLIGSRWCHVMWRLACPGPQYSSLPIGVHYAEDVVPDHWHGSFILLYNIILNSYRHNLWLSKCAGIDVSFTMFETE